MFIHILIPMFLYSSNEQAVLSSLANKKWWGKTMRKLRKVGKGTSSHPTYLKFPPCFLVSFIFPFNNYLHFAINTVSIIWIPRIFFTCVYCSSPILHFASLNNKHFCVKISIMAFVHCNTCTACLLCHFVIWKALCEYNSSVSSEIKSLDLKFVWHFHFLIPLKCCHGWQYLHEQGITHRDLKVSQ